jgi:hypothetical protein
VTPRRAFPGRPLAAVAAAGLSCLCTLAGATAAPASAPAELPCIAVFGHGRNLSGTDPKVNETWNRINTVFNRAVEEAVRPLGRPTVTFLIPVEGRNLDTMFPSLVRLAGAERCDTLIETAMYADAQRHLFVSRIIVRAIVLQPDAASGHERVIGRQLYDRERTDPMSNRTLETLQPDAVARELLRDLVPAAAP